MPDIGDIRFSDITRALLPSSGSGIVLVLDILLYIMFFLNLVAFFMQSDKQIQATIFMATTLLLNVIAKLSTARPDPIIAPKSLISLVVNAGVFVIPLIVTGMSKAKNSKPLTLISGVVGGAFFFMYWFFLQRV
ncbi:MAG: hypothetical protein ACOYL5_01150 [Phototrophicaceae bacterium]